MVPLKKLRKAFITEEFIDEYIHYVEQRKNMIESEYHNLISILNTSQTSVKSRQVNEEIKSKITLKIFTDKVCDYFLRILYINMKTSDDPISVTACVNDALSYTTSEYLALSVVRCIS